MWSSGAKKPETTMGWDQDGNRTGTQVWEA
jgi:hypothetical protein